jgi:hypothetical protein
LGANGKTLLKATAKHLIKGNEEQSLASNDQEQTRCKGHTSIDKFDVKRWWGHGHAVIWGLHELASSVELLYVTNIARFFTISLHETYIEPRTKAAICPCLTGSVFVSALGLASITRVSTMHAHPFHVRLAGAVLVRPTWA